MAGHQDVVVAGIVQPRIPFVVVIDVDLRRTLLHRVEIFGRVVVIVKVDDHFRRASVLRNQESGIRNQESAGGRAQEWGELSHEACADPRRPLRSALERPLALRLCGGGAADDHRRLDDAVRVTEPALSPDGSTVMFVRTTTDPQTGRRNPISGSCPPMDRRRRGSCCAAGRRSLARVCAGWQADRLHLRAR